MPSCYLFQAEIQNALVVSLEVECRLTSPPKRASSAMGSQTKVRRWGVVLTEAGLQRLNSARRQAEIQDNDGDRFTLEELCDRPPQHRQSAAEYRETMRQRLSNWQRFTRLSAIA